MPRAWEAERAIPKDAQPSSEHADEKILLPRQKAVNAHFWCKWELSTIREVTLVHAPAEFPLLLLPFILKDGVDVTCSMQHTDHVDTIPSGK
jgi:hypothetical protein